MGGAGSGKAAPKSPLAQTLVKGSECGSNALSWSRKRFSRLWRLSGSKNTTLSLGR